MRGEKNLLADKNGPLHPEMHYISILIHLLPDILLRYNLSIYLI